VTGGTVFAARLGSIHRSAEVGQRFAVLVLHADPGATFFSGLSSLTVKRAKNTRGVPTGLRTRRLHRSNALGYFRFV